MSLHLFDTLFDAETFISKNIRNVASKSSNKHIKDLVYAKYNSHGGILCAVWKVHENGGMQYAVSDFIPDESSRTDDYSKIEAYMAGVNKYETAIEIASAVQTLHGIPHSFTKSVIVNMAHRNEVEVSNCKANGCLMYKKR